MFKHTAACLRPYILIAALCLFCVYAPLQTAAAASGQKISALQIINKAALDSASGTVSVYDMLPEIEKAAAAAESDSDLRSLYTFLASLNEQLGLYADASRWYASAAGIAAPPAPGTPAYTSEQLVLAAVRAALSGGEFSTAESYLSSIRNTKTAEIAAFVKLYNIWIWLCRAQDEAALLEPVVLLESYAGLASMEIVRPSVYFTLWHITGKSSWKAKLVSEYPNSPEGLIASGGALLYPSPFWYFVPRMASAAETETAVSVPVQEQESAVSAETPAVIIKQQVGFFRSRANAEDLAKRIRAAGFSPAISEEKRASGTVYFVVTVPEDSSGTTGLKLKSAGFECYPVFAE